MGSAKGAQDELVYIPVTISNFTGNLGMMDGSDYIFNCVLQIDNMYPTWDIVNDQNTWGRMSGTAGAFQVGEICVGGDGLNKVDVTIVNANVTGGGLLATITLPIPAGTTPGLYNISFVSNSDNNLGTDGFSINCGTITVTDGSTPPVVSYTVTTDNSITGGSLVADPASGASGDTITVNVTPDKGYRFVPGSLKYTTDGGGTYTAITATDGVYSFTMPEANVVVTAHFEYIPGTVYTVTTDSAITGGSLAADPASGVSGDTITVNVTPDNGYKFATGSLKYTTDGGRTYTAITSVNGAYSFAMPEADVVVTAQFRTFSTFDIVATATIGGTISPVGSTTVTEDGIQVYTITPDEGNYHISDVIVDGASVLTGDSNYVLNSDTGIATYTFPAVTANHTIVAIFDSGSPMGSLAAVYLDGAAGSDENDGASATAAVKTFAKAKELLAKDGVIHITGKVSVSGTEYWTLRYYGSAIVKRDSSYTGEMISTESNADLTLEDITIDGGCQDGITATGSILNIVSLANLTMQDGTVLQNNYLYHTDHRYNGGAVTINGASVFTMNGGVIQNNTSLAGGGVYLGDWACPAFIMNGGEIKNNTATDLNGGGVYVLGKFTMNGGAISNNTAASTICGGNYGCGGGVAVQINSQVKGNQFTMNGGVIENNTARKGGGLYNGNENGPNDGATSVINGGSIINNHAEVSGGGVYQLLADKKGSLTMTGGAISGNTADGSGNGIYTEGSQVILSPASSGNLNIADSIYLPGLGSLRIGSSLADISGKVRVIKASAASGSLIAAGSGYTPVAGDVARFVYDTYEWDFALNGSSQIVLETPAANNLISTDESSLTFDMAAEGYSASVVPNQTVTVNNLSTATITLNQPTCSNNLTVSGLSQTTLAPGESATFTAAPATGLAAGSHSGAILVSTTENAKIVVKTSFEVGYSLTLIPTEKGTITLSPYKTIIAKGDYTQVTIKPAPGYYMVEAIVNGKVKSTNPDGTDFGFTITQNSTISGVFELGTYTLTASVYNNEGGTITPADATTITGLQKQTYNFMPDTGYHVDSVYVDNIAVEPGTYTGNTFTLTVTANHTIVVVFAINQCTIVFDKNADDATGSMEEQSFAYGDEGTLTKNTFSRSGYTFAGWATTTGGTKIYDDETAVANVAAANNGTVTLYAVWFSTVPSTHPDLTAAAATVGQDVTLTFTDSENWRNAINVISVDGIALDSSAYSVAAGTITIDKSVFSTDKDYDIIVSATGYSNAGITLTMQAASSSKPVYTTTPIVDEVYTIGTTEDGIKTMTVNTSHSGIKYFTVNISPVISLSGDETALFVHLRNDAQLELNASRADFDLVQAASAGFNVLAGDVVKVYLVDELSNASDFNPTVLQ